MKLNGTITEILPERSGTSANGDYKFIPIIVTIPEDCHRYDGTTFVREHTIKVDVGGRLAQNFTLPVGSEVTIDIAFQTHEKNGNHFLAARSSYIALR